MSHLTDTYDDDKRTFFLRFLADYYDGRDFNAQFFVEQQALFIAIVDANGWRMGTEFADVTICAVEQYRIERTRRVDRLMYGTPVIVLNR